LAYERLKGYVMPQFDDWVPSDPPNSSDDGVINEIDPRVNATHSIGQLPVPINPPPPIGWIYWKGAVPPQAGTFAVKILHDSITYPMGSFVQFFAEGELIGARVEWHNIQGATGKRGCFRGVNLMRDVPDQPHSTIS
jgi:hypothetical protein